MDDSITVPQHAVSPPAAHSTGTHPLPSQDVVFLFAMKEINIFINNKQTKKYLLHKNFLMIREAPEQPEHEASIVDRSDNEAYILLKMVLTWCSDLRIQNITAKLKNLRQLFSYLNELLKQSSSDE